MADIYKIKIGRNIVAVDINGNQYKGEFRGVIPAKPYHTDAKLRRERFGIRDGCIMQFLPVLGTSVKIAR